MLTKLRSNTTGGRRASLWGWYQHAKMIVTSDGTKTGVQRVTPSNLSTSGAAFNVNIVPAFNPPGSVRPYAMRPWCGHVPVTGRGKASGQAELVRQPPFRPGLEDT